MKNKIEYKEIDGMFFHKKTNEKVCKLITEAYRHGFKLKLYYGDTETGKDWIEEYDTIGGIGRSTGQIKIPLLIKTTRSMGGGAILDDCIVKIKQYKGGTLYQHPKYQSPKVEIVKSDLPEYQFNTLVNGEIHGRHNTERGAVMCKNRIA